MASKKHYHIYERIGSRPGYFRCADRDCSHLNHRDLILGKAAICPFGDPSRPHVYIVDGEALKRHLPHCRDCSGRSGTAPRKQEVFSSDLAAPSASGGGSKPNAKRPPISYAQTNSITGKIEPAPADYLKRARNEKNLRRLLLESAGIAESDVDALIVQLHETGKSMTKK
jgi:hypothetical protein